MNTIFKMSWREKGNCWGKTTSPKTDFWYPEDNDPDKQNKIRIAKGYCKTCPVMQECLDFALSNEEEFGIWSGMTPRERRTYKRRHGTNI